MDKRIIFRLRESFERQAKEKDGIECWLARDLQELLGYEDWRNFLNVIEKGKASCATSGHNVRDHFVEVTKTISMPKGASKTIPDVLLTRYACYLISQNGDPKKEQIAFAQAYFAIQTRKQELIEERIALQERLEARSKLVASESEFSKLIFERGVDESGFSRIRSKGDEALFGGQTTRNMKERLGVPKSRPLADFLPTVTITAKNLATEITNHNVRKENLHGEPDITDEHVKNNSSVRGALTKSGIVPEDLPPDIRKLERRVKKEKKSLARQKDRREP